MNGLVLGLFLSLVAVQVDCQSRCDLLFTIKYTQFHGNPKVLGSFLINVQSVSGTSLKVQFRNFCINRLIVK